MANRFSKYLSNLLPRTGRIINERGEAVNQGDAILTDDGVAALDGRLFRGFWEGTVPAGQTYTFVLDIPADIDLIGFVRNSEVRESTLITRFLTVTGFTSAEGPIDGLSFDRRTGRKSISQAKLHRASATTGDLPHSPDAYLYVGASQATRDPSVQTEAGALPAFDENELPAFQYENDTGAAAQLALYLFWQELSNV